MEQLARVGIERVVAMGATCTHRHKGRYCSYYTGGHKRRIGFVASASGRCEPASKEHLRCQYKRQAYTEFQMLCLVPPQAHAGNCTYTATRNSKHNKFSLGYSTTTTTCVVFINTIHHKRQYIRRKQIVKYYYSH